MPNTLTTLRKSAHHAQQGCCIYCDKPIWLGTKQLPAFAITHGYTLKQARLLQCTAEHLIARAEGGRHTAANIAAACAYCNRLRHQRKHPLPPGQYRQYVMSRVRRGRWHRL